MDTQKAFLSSGIIYKTMVVEKFRVRGEMTALSLLIMPSKRQVINGTRGSNT